MEEELLTKDSLEGRTQQLGTDIGWITSAIIVIVGILLPIIFPK